MFYVKPHLICLFHLYKINQKYSPDCYSDFWKSRIYSTWCNFDKREIKSVLYTHSFNN